MRRVVVTGLLCCLALLLTHGVFAKEQPKKAVNLDAMVKDIAPFEYVCREFTGPYTGFPKGEVAFLDEFKKSGIKATGPEVALYWNSPLYVKPEALKWDIGYPVAGGQKKKGNLTVKKFDFKKVAVATHKGPYATTYLTIGALYEWIAAKKLQTVGGPCVESYMDANPDKVPDDKKVTEIWVPVK
ncbi:GyrI-like domain-containing protein [bacterium]|nr:GyrI-like domain-containing protein [bacterium]